MKRTEKSSTEGNEGNEGMRQGNNSSDKYSADSPAFVCGLTKELRKRKNSTKGTGAEAAKDVKSKLEETKEAWKKLPEEEQESWLEQVASGARPDEIGNRVVKELHIEPYYPYEPLSFLGWLRDERVARLEAQTLAITEKQLQEENPDWTLDEVREKLLKLAYRWSVEVQDFKTGMQTINAHCRTENAELNQRRYEDSKRAAEAKAMQFCLDETRDYPEVQELFKQAFAALEKATAPK